MHHIRKQNVRPRAVAKTAAKRNPFPVLAASGIIAFIISLALRGLS